MVREFLSGSHEKMGSSDYQRFDAQGTSMRSSHGDVGIDTRATTFTILIQGIQEKNAEEIDWKTLQPRGDSKYFVGR